MELKIKRHIDLREKEEEEEKPKPQTGPLIYLASLTEIISGLRKYTYLLTGSNESNKT